MRVAHSGRRGLWPLVTAAIFVAGVASCGAPKPGLRGGDAAMEGAPGAMQDAAASDGSHSDSAATDAAPDAQPGIDGAPLDSRGVDAERVDSGGVDSRAVDAGGADSPDDAAAPGPVCDHPVEYPGTLGFVSATQTGTTFHAIVSEVAGDQLVLTPDAGGSVTFVWRGPSLVSEFAVGDPVDCERTGGWSIVRSASRTALISFQFTDTGLPMTGTIPGGANYRIVPQCLTTSTLMFCGTPPVVQTTIYYGLMVSRAGETADVAPGATAALGDWRVTNILVNGASFSQFNPPGCITDFVSWDLISVLRPAP